eukprot:351491-Chlamydomonas_euryale.AAC.7
MLTCTISQDFQDATPELPGADLSVGILCTLFRRSYLCFAASAAAAGAAVIATAAAAAAAGAAVITAGTTALGYVVQIVLQF